MLFIIVMIYKTFLSLGKLYTSFFYSQFECSGNTYVAISSGLLADAVLQTWPSATGRKAGFLQKFLKRENLKFMLFIWESILRDQTEFKTFFFSSSDVSNDGWLGRRWRLGKCRWACRWWFWQVIMKPVISMCYQACG